MQHEMHLAIETLRTERDLQDRALKHHYLVAGEQIRQNRISLRDRVIAALRLQRPTRTCSPHARGI